MVHMSSAIGGEDWFRRVIKWYNLFALTSKRATSISELKRHTANLSISCENGHFYVGVCVLRLDCFLHSIALETNKIPIALFVAINFEKRDA